MWHRKISLRPATHSWPTPTASAKRPTPREKSSRSPPEESSARNHTEPVKALLPASLDPVQKFSAQAKPMTFTLFIAKAR